MNAREAIEKMRADLEWCGPNGFKMRTICLPRDGVEALVQLLEPVSPIDTIDAIMRLATSLSREKAMEAAEQMKAGAK
jgi:hypothetical protein